MKTTLIICCKNEAQTLASVITSAKPYVDELLVIDGHSTDGSRQVAKKNGATVIIDNGNGKGAGIQLGIRKATGDIIVFMDADGSHNASDIPKLVKPLIDKHADLVIASRTRGGSDDVHGSLDDTIRAIGSAIIAQVINWRYHSQITDAENGFRAIRTSIAKQLPLTVNSFAIEQDMLMKTLAQRHTVTEIASHEFKRMYGKSKIDLWSVWFQFIGNALINCFRLS